MTNRSPVRLLMVGLSAALLFTSAATSTVARGAQAARQKVDVSRLGPQVGQRVPDFNLNDQNGRAHNLQSIMGSRGAMLVFFRSADW